MKKVTWKHNPIGVYLMYCYAYDVLGVEILPKISFMVLGKHIQKNWASIRSTHKRFIDRNECGNGIAVTCDYSKFPLKTLMAAHGIAGIDFKDSRIYGEKIGLVYSTHIEAK